MFTRNSATASRGIADIARIDRNDAPRGATIDAEAARQSPPPIGEKPGGHAGEAGGTERSYSIIGNDLTIVGQGLRIITRGTLQVDGVVEGDVVGNEVIIGEKGRVTGVVSGDSVEVRGAVSGIVKAMTVMLRDSAKVAGDVHHRQLTVEQGAHLDGRVRRPEDTNELKPVFE